MYVPGEIVFAVCGVIIFVYVGLFLTLGLVSGIVRKRERYRKYEVFSILFYP